MCHIHTLNKHIQLLKIRSNTLTCSVFHFHWTLCDYILGNLRRERFKIENIIGFLIYWPLRMVLNFLSEWALSFEKYKSYQLNAFTYFILFNVINWFLITVRTYFIEHIYKKKYLRLGDVPSRIPIASWFCLFLNHMEKLTFRWIHRAWILLL